MPLIRQSLWSRSLPALGIVLAAILSVALLLALALRVFGGGATTGVATAIQAGRTDMVGALAGDGAAADRIAALQTRLAAAEDSVPAAAASTLSAALAAVTAGRGEIAAFHGERQQLQLLLPELLVSVGGLMSALPSGQLAANDATLARFESLVQALGYTLESLSRPGSDLTATAGDLADARDYLNAIVRTLNGTGSEVDLTPVAGIASDDAVAATTELFGRASAALESMISSSERIGSLAGAVDRFDAVAADLYASDSPAASGWTADVPFYLLLAAFVVMAGIVFAYYKARDYRRAAELQAEQSERDQHAILRLLDELSSLADGDLTVEATVTEDITGAIADSINYAIDALRELVATVNESSILVDAASKQTESTATQLVRSSEVQSRQVKAASESVAKMNASVEEISGDSERCADVARYSVDIAHKGGEAVRRTIEGMNTIRETIQDTSKRIKRLGESSQEIGNIVELIEEIAEQTNILALNASIEASRAGEASRGFAVVADEVQKLAERSTSATRKIEVLVSTIQSDTNEAVVSMERSTTDVVGGALLAENAGAALEEIEQVSHQIASLVQNISGTARGQSTVSAAIRKNMDVLREISARNQKATNAASGHIQRLSELASQLRQTVRGFRLPDDVTSTGILSQTEVADRLAEGTGDDDGPEEPVADDNRRRQSG